MIFEFPDNEVHTFWMSDTRFPLDLVPLDGSGRVIDVIEMEPCERGLGCPTYAPDAPYEVALEFPSGSLAQWGYDLSRETIEVARTGVACDPSGEGG